MKIHQFQVHIWHLCWSTFCFWIFQGSIKCNSKWNNKGAWTTWSEQVKLASWPNKSCIHSDDFSETLFSDFWPLTEFLLWSRRQLKYRFSSRFFPRWPGARRFLSDSSDYGRAPRPLPNFAVPNLYKATLLYILSWLTLSIYCVIMSEWTNFWNTKPKKNVVQTKILKI